MRKKKKNPKNITFFSFSAWFCFLNFVFWLVVDHLNHWKCVRQHNAQASHLWVKTEICAKLIDPQLHIIRNTESSHFEKMKLKGFTLVKSKRLLSLMHSKVIYMSWAKNMIEQPIMWWHRKQWTDEIKRDVCASFPMISSSTLFTFKRVVAYFLPNKHCNSYNILTIYMWTIKLQRSSS